jgi:hypothetical protein
MQSKSEIILIVVKIDTWDGSTLIFFIVLTAGRTGFPVAVASFSTLADGGRAARRYALRIRALC